MSDYNEFPDIEAVCSKAIRAAGVAGGRSYSSIPSSPSYPLCVVRRIGGLPADKRALDSAHIQVDVWADDKATARREAAAARRAIHRLEGTADEQFEAFVTEVEDQLGLLSLEDPDTDKDRYVFAVLVHAHGEPAPSP